MKLAHEKGRRREDLTKTKMKTGMTSSMACNSICPEDASNAHVFISSCESVSASTISLGVQPRPEASPDPPRSAGAAAAARSYGPAVWTLLALLVDRACWLGLSSVPPAVLGVSSDRSSNRQSFVSAAARVLAAAL
eukprot:CAMPEP_0171254530 /NCGR_PEP_ID=MMETSP0790-20130122/52282_1 /TAXON_ID=2925 /ORGANISM="Alexandrium catenella, Strain OF101" /LENGTH=135 /DNA_ID=CAMNT_0011722421 /DNA_START=123 /DNA_END=525 /DNA_ORIENTATION=+